MTAPELRLEGPRLLAHPLARAVVQVVNERGYESAELADFARRAGVPVVECDRHCAGKADLVLRLLEAALGDFRRRVGAAYEAGGDWLDSLRAAGHETVRWILEHPELTRFAMVSTVPAGDMARARRDELFLWGASLVDEGRALAPDPAAVPRRAGIVAVGSVVEELRRDQEGDLGGDLVAAVPRLMYGAVRPYLGEAVARRELDRPLPADLERRRCR